MLSKTNDDQEIVDSSDWWMPHPVYVFHPRVLLVLKFFLSGAQAPFKKRIVLMETYKWIPNPSESFKFGANEKWGGWFGSSQGSHLELLYKLHHLYQIISFSSHSADFRASQIRSLLYHIDGLFTQGLGLFRLPSFCSFLYWYLLIMKEWGSF